MFSLALSSFHLSASSISIAALLTSNISSNGMGEVSPEFIDLITREKLPDAEDVMYSHLEYRDEHGKLLKKYRDLRKKYKKRSNKNG